VVDVLEGLGEFLVLDFNEGGGVVVVSDDLEEVEGFLGGIDGSLDGFGVGSEGSMSVSSSGLFVTEGLGSLVDGGEFFVNLVLEVTSDVVISIDSSLGVFEV